MFGRREPCKRGNVDEPEAASRHARTVWTDHLLEKHECASYERTRSLDIELGDRRLALLLPEWLPEVEPITVAEHADLVFVVGAIRAPSDRHVDGDGVVLVARRRDGNSYAVHVWHALYPWALRYLVGEGAKERDHAALLLLFQNRPTLALELLRQVFGVDTEAAGPAQIESVDVTEAVPAELRADFVVRYVGGRKALVVVVEVQRRRDPAKRFTWPAYVALLRARFRSDVRLLVVAPDPAVARWCRRPIALGNDAMFTPTVLSSDEIPAVTDPEIARADPELSVLSAIAHGGGEVGRAVAVGRAGLAAVEELGSIDTDRAVIYFDLIRAALSEAARKAIDAMISQKYEFQSDFALRYIAEGKAEGKAKVRPTR